MPRDGASPDLEAGGGGGRRASAKSARSGGSSGSLLAFPGDEQLEQQMRRPFRQLLALFLLVQAFAMAAGTLLLGGGAGLPEPPPLHYVTANVEAVHAAAAVVVEAVAAVQADEAAPGAAAAAAAAAAPVAGAPVAPATYAALRPAGCGLLAVSYSMEGGKGGAAARVRRAGEALGAAAPDVAGVQGLASEEQLAAMGEAAGGKPYRPLFNGGLGLLTRLDVVSASTFPLRGSPPALYARVDAGGGGGHLNVFVVQLGGTPDEQCGAAAELVAQLDAPHFPQAEPFLVLGDLASTDAFTAAADFVATRKVPPGTPASCARLLGQALPGTPLEDAAEGLPTHPASHGGAPPRARPDRILTRGKLARCASGAIGGVEAALLQGGRAELPSTHLGVAASFRVPGQTAPPVPVQQPRPAVAAAPPSSPPPPPPRQQQQPFLQQPQQQPPPPPPPPQQQQQQQQPFATAPAASDDPADTEPEDDDAPLWSPKKVALPNAMTQQPGSAQVRDADMVPHPRGREVLLARPAMVVSSLSPYDFADDHAYHGPERAFDGSLQTFFWSGEAARSGDHVTVTLHQGARVSSVSVLTGHPPIPGRAAEQMRDALRKGVLEVAFERNDPHSGDAFMTPFAPVARFESGAASARLDAFYPDQYALLKAVRVRVEGTQVEWLVVREIVLGE